MKKLTTLLALASLFTVGLVSCQKDDTDVTILSSVAGDFVGQEACPGPIPAGPAAHEYAVHIYNQSDAGNNKVFINNLYELGDTYEATVNGQSITLAASPYSYTVGSGMSAQTRSGTMSATGNVNGSILTLNFTLTGSDAGECVFVGNRAYRYPSEGN